MRTRRGRTVSGIDAYGASAQLRSRRVNGRLRFASVSDLSVHAI